MTVVNIMFHVLFFQMSLTPQEKQYYGSVVLWKDTAEPDLSFSFVSSICEASGESDGTCDFIHRAFVIISGTCK